MTPQENALAEVSNGIQDGLFESDNLLGTIVQTLEGWLSDALKSQDASVTKIGRKVTSHINRQLTVQANGLDAISTALAMWAGNALDLGDWTLTGLAVKAGLCDAGKTLYDVEWDQEPAASLGPEYGGMLVLDCRGLADQLAPLLEVLREIRDRMPPLQIAVPGTVMAEQGDENQLEPVSFDVELVDEPIVSTEDVA